MSLMHMFRVKNWSFASNVEFATTTLIASFWNSSTIIVEIINISTQGIYIVIKNLVNQCSFTFVYGYNTSTAMRVLLDDLKTCNPVSPWM